MKRTITLAGALLLGTATWSSLRAFDAAALTLTAPILGYVFDPVSQAIHVVPGLPGAATLGAAVPAPEALQQVAIHSTARVAIAVAKDGHLVALAWTADQPAQFVALDSAVSAPEQVAFSRSGAKVVIRDAGTVEVWTNLASTPALDRRFSAPPGLVAVSDAGTVVVAGDNGVTVYGIGGGTGEPRMISAGGGWTAVAFSAADEVLAANATRLEVVRMDPAGGSKGTVAVAAPATALLDSADGTALLALEGTQAVVVARTGESAAIDCGCEVSGFDALTGNLVAALRGTTLVVDGEGATPRLTTLTYVAATQGAAQ